MTYTVETKQLSVAFKTASGLLPAIDDINFQLAAGETLALLGESGCGKSLTALALMRLLPLTSGYGDKSAIYAANQSLLDMPEVLMQRLRGRRLAMIFQEPMTALNPVLSIGQQLAEAIRQHQRCSKSFLYEQMIALLNEVEMPHPKGCLQKYPHQLSGGQKQRVVIAMALAGKPDVLIADEPTTALDVTIQAQLLALLKKIQQQRGMSVLLITHDLSVVRANAHYVCLMYAGQIVEMATVDDFFNQPLHPYGQQLLRSIPSLTWRGQFLPVIEGYVPGLEAMPKGCRFHPRCAHRFEPCDNKAPSLQTQQASKREVRCHLYPQHTRLPALPVSPLMAIASGPNESSAPALLDVVSLSVYLRQKKRLWPRKVADFKAVDEVSFRLNKGKTLALVGESGCGKTTTAMTIMRLQAPTSGAIYYEGENIHRFNKAKRRYFQSQVQMIFQDPYSSMNPRLTVAEIIAEGLYAQGASARLIQQRQYQLLDDVQLPRTALSRYPHQFSGGQRQRIAIARALATKPQLLICDEPTSALDVSVQAQILNVLKALQSTHGLSYLFISHNMSVVAYMADEVMVMRAGTIVEQGECLSLLKRPQQDYTKALLTNASH